MVPTRSDIYSRSRGDLSKIFDTNISRDMIVGLRSAGLLASGLHKPTPGSTLNLGNDNIFPAGHRYRAAA